MEALITAEEFLDEFGRRLADATFLSKAVITNPPNQEIDDTSPAWTNALLNLIIRWGTSRGFSTYPSQVIYNVRTGKNALGGEYLFDASWYATEDECTEWWEVSQSPDRRNNGFILCVESEWGESSTPMQQFNSMMDDFAKLTEVKADLKVFIGTYQPQGTVGGRSMLDEFLRVTELYAGTHRWTYPGEQYLVMLWAFDAEWQDRNTFKRKIIRPLGDRGPN